MENLVKSIVQTIDLGTNKWSQNFWHSLCSVAYIAATATPLTANALKVATPSAAGRK